MTIQHPQYLFAAQKIIKTSSNVESFSANKTCKLLFIYEDENAELPPTFKDMLQKLAAACKFKPEEVFYLNYSLQPVSLSVLQNKFQTEVILIFGDISLSQNLISLSKNFPYEINGIKILRTENLETLEKVKAEKILLWNVLKQMLGN